MFLYNFYVDIENLKILQKGGSQFGKFWCEICFNSGLKRTLKDFYQTVVSIKNYDPKYEQVRKNKNEDLFE